MLTPLWKGFEYKPHQLTGVEWMLTQETDSTLRGGFLCDEMGLGKTMEVLGLIKNSKLKRTLLVAPLAVLKQWEEAARKSKINTYIVDRDTYTWAAAGKMYAEKPCIYIVHYECAKRRTSLTDQFSWDRIVFDEAHRLCNDKSKVHKAMAAIEAKCRWVLTATPIVNDFTDARSLFQMIGLAEEDTPRNKRTMEALIYQKALCRTVEELRPIIPELPKEETTHIHTLPFETKEERDFYRSIQANIVDRLKIMMEEGADEWVILKLLLLLRQLSVHPQVYIEARRKDSRYYQRDDWEGDSTKFSALKKLIQDQATHQHRWIIFTHFHDEMELLAASLRLLPPVRRVQLYSGKQTQDEREEIVRLTKEPLDDVKNTEILLVQLQSGSVGLNLQHFDRVAFLSPWWTAALMDQAVGRAVRIGQEKQVEVHHFRLEEEKSMNIDAVMVAKVEEKRELCRWFLKNASRGLESAEEKLPVM